VSFENEIAKVLASHGEAAAARVPAQVVDAPGGAARADGNNVNIDEEMGRLSKNALLDNAYAQILMVNLMTASRAYEANLRVVQAFRQNAEQALALGRA
jgi:flagellar basal body rod protein FlgB